MKQMIYLHKILSASLLLIVAMSLLAMVFVVPEEAEAAQSAAALAKFRVPQADGTGERFLGGFYVYDGKINAYVNEQGLSHDSYLDSMFKDLAGRGFNLYYVSAGKFDPYIAASEKYQFKMIFQLDACYLPASATLAEARKKAECAIPIIKKYKDHQNVLGFSVREEPRLETMEPLMEYYRTVRASVPDAQFHLLYAGGAALPYEVDPSLVPVIIGNDTYPFRGWEWSGGGYAVTPAFALKTLNNQFNKHRANAYKYGAIFNSVISTSYWVMVTSDASVKAQHPNEYARVKALVPPGYQSWKDLGNGRWLYVQLYYPPPNSTKAMVWVSVLNGARAITDWAWIPTTKATRDSYANRSYVTDPSKQGQGVHMPGMNNAGSYMLDEYAAAIKKLQDYGWIINRMKVSAKPDTVTSSQKKILTKAFDLPGYSGKVVVLVNTDVGTWPANSVQSLSLASTDIDFKISEAGQLVGYKANTAPLETTLTTTLPGALYNISSGSALSANKISVDPGEGAFIFVGTAAEIAKLRTDSGLTAGGSGGGGTGGGTTGGTSLTPGLCNAYSSGQVPVKDIIGGESGVLNKSARNNIAANDWILHSRRCLLPSVGGG